VGKDASSDGSLFVTHSDDGEGNPDVRLSFIPAADHPAGSARALWPDLEDNPRYVGYGRGDTYLPSNPDVPPGQPLTEAIGSVPQVNHTFAYTEGNYGIMNERQLSIGESTCSGAFAAKAGLYKDPEGAWFQPFSL
jgi:dipeptidase